MSILYKMLCVLCFIVGVGLTVYMVSFEEPLRRLLVYLVGILPVAVLSLMFLGKAFGFGWFPWRKRRTRKVGTIHIE